MTKNKYRIRAERKQISITHALVKAYLEDADNASEYIERAILFYEDFESHDYITRQEVDGLLANFKPAKENVKKKSNLTHKDVDQIFSM